MARRICTYSETTYTHNTQTHTDTHRHARIACRSLAAEVFRSSRRCSSYAAPAGPSGPAESGECWPTSFHWYAFYFSAKVRQSWPRETETEQSIPEIASGTRDSQQQQHVLPA